MKDLALVLRTTPLLGRADEDDDHDDCDCDSDSDDAANADDGGP